MRTEEEVREKLKSIRRSKASAKYSGKEVSYIYQSKLEKLLKWILGEE